jgi:hypothetical protein
MNSFIVVNCLIIFSVSCGVDSFPTRRAFASKRKMEAV